MCFHKISTVVASALLSMGAITLGGCADPDAGSEAKEPESTTAATEQALTQPVTATLKISSSWNDGYCASVNVTNKGTATLTAWVVIMGINPAGISTIWNAEPSIVGVPQYRQLVAQSKAYNSALAPNASTEFGFCGLGATLPSIVTAQGFN